MFSNIIMGDLNHVTLTTFLIVIFIKEQNTLHILHTIHYTFWYQTKPAGIEKR